MAVLAWLVLVALVAIVVIVVFPEVTRVLTRFAREKRLAEERAAMLLAELLAPEDLAHLNERGYLVVRSPKRPNRVYHVPRQQGMVSVYDGGVLTERLCVGSTRKIPDGDAVLLHKLMIEGNEDEYLLLANHFSPRPYTFPL